MNEIDNLQLPTPPKLQQQLLLEEEEEEEERQEKTKQNKKSRLSRLFQKKPKKNSSKDNMSTSLSTMSISDPSLLKQATFPSTSSIASSHLSIPTPTLVNNEQQEPKKRTMSMESRNIPVAHNNNNNNNNNTNIETASQLSRSLSISSNRSTMNIQTLLAQQRHLLSDLDTKKQMYQSDNAKLLEQISKTQEKIQQRSGDMETLKGNYQAHLDSVRSSGDDPKSIANKLSTLQATIAILAQELLPYAEPILTTEKLSTLWTNLGDSIRQLDSPLPPERIQMLTEKFMMDVLIQNLNIYVFPGLSCNQEFMELSSWFDHNDTTGFFSTRLRQEVNLSLLSDQNDEEMETTFKQCVDRTWHHLYRGLQKAYPSYLISSSSSNNNNNKRISFSTLYSQTTMTKATEYGNKLRNLVQETVLLGSAIKGQEVCITAVDIREGIQPFDSHLMTDQDGQTTGVIAFCISPPFVVKTAANRYEPLLKGRVLCFPSSPSPSPPS